MIVLLRVCNPAYLHVAAKLPAHVMRHCRGRTTFSLIFVHTDPINPLASTLFAETFEPGTQEISAFHAQSASKLQTMRTTCTPKSKQLLSPVSVRLENDGLQSAKVGRVLH